MPGNQTLGRYFVTDYTLSGPPGHLFHCLLFDLGNTLWNRDEHALARLELVADQDAIDILRLADPSNSFLDDDRESAAALRVALLKQFEIEIEKDPLIEPDGATLMQQVLLARGWKGNDPTLGKRLFDALQVSIAQSRMLFADALSTLQVLQKRSFQLGIVTNRYWGGMVFHEDLQTMGLLEYFDYDKMAISADLYIRKPNQAIFLHALNACQARADTTLMVGDSLIADVAGSQQLGMFAVWKPRNYNEIQHYLEVHEGKSVDTYNQQQVDLFLQQGVVASPVPCAYERTELEYFVTGQIRPQLIINNLSELLSWI